MRWHFPPRAVALLAALVLGACVSEGAGSLEDVAVETNRPTPASSSHGAGGSVRPAPPTSRAPSPDAASPTDEEVSVVSVTDGDTLRVVLGGVNEALRLIGINAPERGECLATEATQRLADLVGAGTVRLESDTSDRDDYGRLLRYVHVGDVLVNETLVREGLALAHRYQPDTARAVQLEAAQTAAERARAGMWDPTACGTPTAARIEIGRIHYDAAGDDSLNLNDEWVEFVNRATAPVDLSGWSVKDESESHRYHFPAGFRIPGEGAIRLHSGCGEDGANRLYWCHQGSAVWNNSGDTVVVVDPSGNVVASRSY